MEKTKNEFKSSLNIVIKSYIDNLIESVSLPIDKLKRSSFVNSHTDRLEANVLEEIEKFTLVSDALPMPEENMLNRSLTRALGVMAQCQSWTQQNRDVIYNLASERIEQIASNYYDDIL